LYIFDFVRIHSHVPVFVFGLCSSCGALSVGDQVLSIDDTMIEHTAFSPDEVMTILDTSTGRGYTQMQIMPAHALARRGEYWFLVCKIPTSSSPIPLFSAIWQSKSARPNQPGSQAARRRSAWASRLMNSKSIGG